MTAFFPSIMASGSIWYNKDLLNVSSINIFNVFGENGFTQYLNTLLYKPSGAIGEYSILLLVIGGLYLLLRRRISWHIPFGLLTTFFILTLLFQGPDMKFSLGGLLLGTIFMATDMPSSASTKAGKLYYGAMIGLVTALCLLNGIKHEYMSYSILLLNGFATLINWVFKPRVWAAKSDWIKRVWQSTLLTIAITIAAYAVIYLHQHDAVRHVIFGYILFIISRFCFITMKREE
jgi:electron transport complex protein RnfD